MDKLSIGVTLAWQMAVAEAANKKSEFIEKEHIFNGCLSLEKIFAAKEMLNQLGIQAKQLLEMEYKVLENLMQSFSLNMTQLRRLVREKLPQEDYAYKEKVIHRSAECRGYFQKAEELSKGGMVNVLFLLVAILEKPGEIISAVFKELKIEPERLKEEALKKGESLEGLLMKAEDEIKEESQKKSALYWIPKYARDLVKEAEEGNLKPIEGRRDEMHAIIRTVSRMTKNNPVLIGEAGVGKTAIVEGLAQRIAYGKNLIGRRIFELNLSSLVAGTKYRGEFEERLNGIIQEAKEHRAVILFLDEIHNLVGAGKGEGSMDAANILKPALTKGEITCIGATTISEYRKYIEKDAALERRFQPIMITEPTPEETIKILQRLKERFETHHQVKITDEALVRAVELSVRYLPYRQLPDKAIDIIDEACAYISLPQLSMDGIKQDRTTGGVVTEEEVAKVVSKLTGIPVSKLTEKEVEKLLNLDQYLKKRIKGQEKAITIVANKIRLAKTGMRDKNRPLGVFLFLGPTGVGKTLSAKGIAELLFGSEEEMIRLDMSEYQEKHTVSKLIGAPPGYVGYEEEGQLTGKLRSKPYSVVLFDEIEKAHPEVLDIFLQLFDEGRLTDAKGRTIDGRNAIFIMTSNLPPDERMGFQRDATPTQEEATLNATRRVFRPEFLNRIDKIVFFKHLSKENIKEIISLELETFRKGLSKEYGVSLAFGEEVLELLIKDGYSERNGAREIKRIVEERIKEPLSQAMLEREKIGRGIKGWKVRIEVEDGKISCKDALATKPPKKGKGKK
ncbi:MAG: ATP-dependent Clp protease ATP-binding subunit [bacterium]